MARYVFGIVFITGKDDTDTSIGLFNGNLKWLEADVPGLSSAWKSGYIISRTLGNIAMSADFRKSGAPAQVAGTSIKIDATDRIWNYLDTYDISFNGLLCQVVRIDAVNLTESVIYTGIAEKPQWNEKEANIPIHDSKLKRDANLGTLVNDDEYTNASDDVIGKMVPVTFGEIDKAKFIRVANATSTFQTSASLAYGDRIDVSDPDSADVLLISSKPYSLSVFPVVGDDHVGDNPATEYNIKIAWIAGEGDGAFGVYWYLNGVVQSSGTIDLPYFEGKYIHVVDGDGTGEYRQISSAEVDLDVSSVIIKLTISDVFRTQLAGNAAATADGQSWVQIETIERSYEADVWPCKNYIDEDGNVVTGGSLALYAYAENKVAKVTDENTDAIIQETPISFLRLPQYAYEDGTSGGDNNQVNIDVKLFKDSPDQMDSFLILPVVNPQLLDSGNNLLDEWNVDSSDWWIHYQKHAAGIYYRGNAPDITVTSTGALANIIDQDSTTEYRLDITWNTPPNLDGIVIGLTFTMPPVPTGLDFDSVYLLPYFTSLKNSAAVQYSLARILYKRFIGYAKEILTRDNGNKYRDNNSIIGQINALPDFYTGSSGNNRYFYYHNDINGPIAGWVIDTTNNIFGFERFEYDGIDTHEKYNGITKCCFFVWNRPAGDAGSQYVRFFELAVAFKKRISIKDAVYSGLRGRVYDSTWGSRKTSTNLINNPIDIIEHALRLQNWSEFDRRPLNWGLVYADAARINTATSSGGFEYSGLNSVKALSVGRQILDYREAWASKIIQSLCRTYLLCQYKNLSGQECIAYIADKTGGNLDEITLADIPQDENIGDVDEPRIEDIYCSNLTIRYNKNYGSGNYDSIIQITNVSENTYDSSYVVGYDGGYKQALWDRAHDLWAKYKHTEEPPNDLVNDDWSRDASTAAWRLLKWLTWQEKRRIKVPVYYDKAKSWTICGHVYLRLPHQTNNAKIECLIEGINHDAYKGISYVSLVMYDAIGGTGSAGSGSSATGSEFSFSSESTSGSSTSGSSSSTSSESGDSESDSSLSDSSDSVSPSSSSLSASCVLDHDKQTCNRVHYDDVISPNRCNILGNANTIIGNVSEATVPNGGIQLVGIDGGASNVAVGAKVLGNTQNEPTVYGSVKIEGRLYTDPGPPTAIADASYLTTFYNYTTLRGYVRGDGGIYFAGPSAIGVQNFDAAKFEILSTAGAQERWTYTEDVNYAQITVSNVGLATFDAAGSGAAFRFGNYVGIGCTPSSGYLDIQKSAASAIDTIINVKTTLAVAEASQYSVVAEIQLDAGADITGTLTNYYGLLDLNAGDVSSNVYGKYQIIDQEAAHTIDGYTYLSYNVYYGAGTQTGRIYGNLTELRQEAGSTWSDRAYVQYLSLNLDSSTAADLLYSLFLSIDQEAAHTASSTVYGAYIEEAMDGTVSGSLLGINLALTCTGTFGSDIYGVRNVTTLSGTGTLVDDFFNEYSLITMDDTFAIGDDAYGKYIYFNQNAGSIGGDFVNLYIEADMDGAVGGNAYLARFIAGTGIDVGLEIDGAITTHQKWTYDGSNYVTLVIAADGLATFNSVSGSNGQGFVFNDEVGIGVEATGAMLQVRSTTTPQFRVDYDNSNYADHTVDGDGYYTIVSSGGFTGIGDAAFTAAATLHLLKTTATTDATLEILRLNLNCSGTPAADFGGAIKFYIDTPDYGITTETGRIENVIDSVSDADDLSMRFHTLLNGTLIENLRLDGQMATISNITSSSAAVIDMLNITRDDGGNYAAGDGIAIVANIADGAGTLRELFSFEGDWESVSPAYASVDFLANIAGNPSSWMKYTGNVALSSAHLEIKTNLFLDDNLQIRLGNTNASPDGYLEHDTATTPDEVRLEVTAAGEHLRLKNASGTGSLVILETKSTTDASDTGIKMVGDDWEGNDYASAGAGNYRYALIDENGNLVVSGADVDHDGAAV